MLATFSLHSVVNSAGAYAGLGALIGLALLVLLYFAQAREIRRLSDWIEGEEERRATGPLPSPLSSQQPRATVATQGVPPAQPVAGAVTTAVPGVRRVAVPGAQTAPAAAGAAPATAVAGSIPAAIPATTAAAQSAVAAPAQEPAAAPVIAAATAAAQSVASPAPSREEPAVEGDDAPGPRAAGAAVPLSGPRIATAQPPDVPLAGSEGAAAEPEFRRGVAGSEPAGEPELAAAVASGASAAPASEPALQAESAARPDPERGTTEPFAPATAAAVRPRFPAPPADQGAPIPVSAGAMMSAPGLSAAATEAGRFDPFGVEPTRRRPAGEGASGSPPQGPRPRADERPPRPLWANLRLLVVAVAIVAVLIFVVTQLVGGGSSPSAGKTSPTTTSTHTGSSRTHSPARKTPPPAPDTITVSVLNGTTVSHLASGAWSRLQARGFKQGTIANAPSQTHVRTIVGYVSGARAAAVEVAGDLGLSTADAHPVASADLAAGTTGGVTPTVVVTLGSEYAHSQ